MKNNAKHRFVFIDIETGGTIPDKHSLLSIGCIVWDINKGIIGEKELFIFSDKYVITKNARKINHFDENSHNIISKDGNAVILELLNFLYEYFDKKDLIPLIGHNVQFDINFLKVFFKNYNRSFYKYFSHRAIDTYSVYKSLVLINKITENINSSADAFRYFGIKVEKRHSALGDCLATVKLYEKLLEMLK